MPSCSVAVKDPDADVRVIVCGLLGKRNDAEAAHLLADVLTSDGDLDVRTAAARTLGHFHDPVAIQGLGTALDDKDAAMRYRAMESLQESTGKDYGTDPANVDRWRQWVEDRPGAFHPVDTSGSSRGSVRSEACLPSAACKPWEIAVFHALLSLGNRSLLLG